MRKVTRVWTKCLAVVLILSFACGCAVKIQKRQYEDIKKINELTKELEDMNSTLAMLQNNLKDEIKRGDVSVEKETRGIVVTFVAEVLFDSGKAVIKEEGVDMLEKTASVLKKVDNDISIEGHTDNIPIKYSGWKSNWELSTARALSVLHYLVEDQNLNPEKLSATGLGEYHPIASNEIPEGRQKNRRVEIIIKPQLSKFEKSATQKKQTEGKSAVK
ncbi:MAG: OmpA family protein [Candidatus Omnitrophota bacterium]